MHYENLIFAILFGCIGILAYCMRREMEARKAECERKHDGVLTMLSDMATKVGQLDGRCCELEEKYADLPVAQMEEEIKRMNAWNDGVDSILSYGPEVPRLNKEAIKHD